MEPALSQPPDNGQNRVVIAQIKPLVDAGRFAIKRCVGDTICVRAEAFCDGHDRPSCALRWRHKSEDQFAQKLMDDIGWDWWRAELILPKLGTYQLEVVGWVDHFKSWRAALKKRLEAQEDELQVELQIGAQMLKEAALRARRGQALSAAKHLNQCAAQLVDGAHSQRERATLAIDEDIFEQMQRWAPRRFPTSADSQIKVEVEPERARFSSWYEFFPRSPAIDNQRGDARAAVAHATLIDARKRLDYIAEMGFNVVYLPPIHPIGRALRKGPNNSTESAPDDVGSPWAIGAAEGGHQAIHPALGSSEDFDALIQRARELNLDIALDLAFQAAPDHPWVREHPEWFKFRPDGSIQYAENPPKKYEDIYPFDFETEDWRGLWSALEGVVRHWCERGVRVFRVDNPHTKPYALWEWLIQRIKESYPETIFLAEAFSRPAVMQRLAKLGFSQSYTYFTWRNTRWELEEYLRELSQSPVVDYMRPNFWPNTPDILPEPLQSGRRSTFMLRVALAATMSSNYGIYGPAYELMEHVPVAAGSEEYLDSEKYQLRAWQLDQPHSLKPFISRLNRIRQQNTALQQMRLTTIHHADNEEIFVFSKRSAAHDNFILVVANLDPEHTQASMVNLDLEALGVTEEKPFFVQDLLNEARYQWRGARNYVELNPQRAPLHIFRIGERARDERDFDYY